MLWCHNVTSTEQVQLCSKIVSLYTVHNTQLCSENYVLAYLQFVVMTMQIQCFQSVLKLCVQMTDEYSTA